ncbi:MAG: hypothetical protein IKI31_04690 [Treponema sp.]|nr:hypothetical protein [Treponema sp.]
MKRYFFSKVAIFFIIIFANVFSLYALPAVSQFLPDTSGEYVYYEDSPFGRKSYIGFLYYDDATYSIRYYAPTNLENKQVEQHLQLFVTLNPKANHIELTGEKFSRKLTPADGEIVNYMHDMFYELHARRKKAGALNQSAFEEKKMQDNFHQFGGSVVMEYANYIPLFNLKSITNNKNEKVFTLAAIGKLQNEKDESFASFKGFYDELSSKINHPSEKKQGDKKIIINKNAKSKTHKTENKKSVMLDSQWVSAMDNVWFLGEVALLSSHTINTKPENKNLCNFIRYNFNLGRVVNWANTTLEKKNKVFVVKSTCFDSDEKQEIFVIDILREKQNSYDVFRLSIFKNVYDENKSYFDALIKKL